MNGLKREEIHNLIPVLQQLARADLAARRLLQDHGVDVIPSNFYSNTPSLADIESSFEFADSDDPPYDLEGLLDVGEVEQVLDDLILYAQEFSAPQDGDADFPKGFFWNNELFGYSDAMAYYCFLRRYKPQRVVEVGCGFSTFIALDALERNGYGDLVCIEPYPAPHLIENSKIRLETRPVQELGIGYFSELLHDGDVLFIDSTHTVKTGSDCLHLYLRILPHVDKSILVHVHDVFLPRGLPRHWMTDLQLHWTEQHLLLAFLIDNPKARVLYSSVNNMTRFPDKMRTLMCDQASPGGSSFWFSYDGGMSFAGDRKH